MLRLLRARELRMVTICHRLESRRRGILLLLLLAFLVLMLQMMMMMNMAGDRAADRSLLSGIL